ncbi:hypothetical protein JKF63_00676 [Porcisia hertigi]|uniref:Uncharacterized protein n=1 Tax=Porcisia hertigi TaxID=2761500 RepID=A0A836I5C1_9TRYP|nr:hypothetical protein JKF63_00676 [Porcisia hertigi]
MKRLCASSCMAPRWWRACSTPASDSGTAELVIVRESPIDNVVIFEMNNDGDNLLTSKMLSAFLKKINDVCDPDKSRCRGIVLTSKTPGVFSVGLDVQEFATNLSQERFTYYWSQFQQLFTTLHSLPVPLVSAINGDAAEGGCVMALASDYRVMARKHPTTADDLLIGIAATQQGSVVPPYVAGSVEHVVGFRVAEKLLCMGSMLTADEALSIGLVDEVVDQHDQAVVPCLQFMERLLEHPSPVPYWMIKNVSRRCLVAPLCTANLRSQDTVSFYNFFSSSHVKKALAEHTQKARVK